MKTCTKCQKLKNFSDFHKKKSTIDGYAHFCKLCVREYDLKRNRPNNKLPIKINGTKIHCRKCERYLEKKDFPKLRKNGKYTTYTYCLDCDNLIGHLGNLKKYGLTRDNYVDMEKSQNGVCAICEKPERNKKRLSVDHDHSCCPGEGSCGKCIRGLLCSDCNTALGNAKDNPEILQKMIDYLKK